jgi:methane/ammonia monooxygenase subunit B
MKQKPITNIITRLAVAGFLVVLAAAIFAPLAAAHGEKSQQAFLRMRTIHWFDLTWTKEELAINEQMEVSGKFHVFADWPETVELPSIAFLNIGIPGPVFIRSESYIGGQLVPRSVGLTLGKTYDFKVVLTARRPGDWHVHTMLNVKDGGPVIGPGKWVSITGSMGSFVNEVTTLTGNTIDIETFGATNAYFWHFVQYAIGCAWMWWWIRRPVFLPRYLRVNAGNEEDLITEEDRKATMMFVGGTIAFVVFGYFNGNSSYPVTIPLQAGVIGEMVPIDMPEGVSVHLERASYRVPGREVVFSMSITNNSDAPIEVAEFETGGIRFLNEDVKVDETEYPENLLAESGLTVDDSDPVAPGETRKIEIRAQDAAWENERLSALIYDPDSRFGGLFFFKDSMGNEYVVPVGGPMIPVFN